MAEPAVVYFYRTRAFVLSNLVALLMFFGVFGALYWLMQYLQVVLAYSPLDAGIRTLPWTAMPMLVAVLAGSVTGRVGAGRLMAAGLVLEAVALGWSAAIMDASVPYGRIVPALLLGGIGMGLIFAPMTEAVLASVHADDRGKASGANATVRELGFALGVAVLTTVVTRTAGPLTGGTGSSTRCAPPSGSARQWWPSERSPLWRCPATPPRPPGDHGTAPSERAPRPDRRRPARRWVGLSCRQPADPVGGGPQCEPPPARSTSSAVHGAGDRLDRGGDDVGVGADTPDRPPVTSHSTYAAACASPPEESACSW